MDYQTLNLLFRCSRELSHRKTRMQELSDTECMICSYIHSHENCSQDDVSVALRTDKTTVGKALASLENKKCVMRVQDACDKRVKRLSLTDTGQKKVTELMDIHNDWLREIMSCLSKDERKQFDNYCVRLLEKAEKLTRPGGNSQ